MKMGFDLTAWKTFERWPDRVDDKLADMQREQDYIAAMIEAHEDTTHSDFQDLSRDNMSDELRAHIRALCLRHDLPGHELWARRPTRLRMEDGLAYVETARPGRARKES